MVRTHRIPTEELKRSSPCLRQPHYARQNTPNSDRGIETAGAESGEG